MVETKTYRAAIPNVYIVIDDCPEEWGGTRILAVFAERKLAQEFMLRERGRDVVGNQYLEVQKWRVR